MRSPTVATEVGVRTRDLRQGITTALGLVFRFSEVPCSRELPDAWPVEDTDLSLRLGVPTRGAPSIPRGAAVPASGGAALMWEPSARSQKRSLMRGGRCSQTTFEDRPWKCRKQNKYNFRYLSLYWVFFCC